VCVAEKSTKEIRAVVRIATRIVVSSSMDATIVAKHTPGACRGQIACVRLRLKVKWRHTHVWQCSTSAGARPRGRPIRDGTSSDYAALVCPRFFFRAKDSASQRSPPRSLCSVEIWSGFPDSRPSLGSAFPARRRRSVLCVRLAFLRNVPSVGLPLQADRGRRRSPASLSIRQKQAWISVIFSFGQVRCSERALGCSAVGQSESGHDLKPHGLSRFSGTNFSRHFF